MGRFDQFGVRQLVNFFQIQTDGLTATLNFRPIFRLVRLSNLKLVPSQSNGAPHLELEHTLHCVAHNAAEDHFAHETRAGGQIQQTRVHYSRLP